MAEIQIGSRGPARVLRSPGDLGAIRSRPGEQALRGAVAGLEKGIASRRADREREDEELRVREESTLLGEATGDFLDVLENVIPQTDFTDRDSVERTNDAIAEAELNIEDPGSDDEKVNDRVRASGARPLAVFRASEERVRRETRTTQFLRIETNTRKALRQNITLQNRDATIEAATSSLGQSREFGDPALRSDQEFKQALETLTADLVSQSLFNSLNHPNPKIRSKTAEFIAGGGLAGMRLRGLPLKDAAFYQQVGLTNLAAAEENSILLSGAPDEFKVLAARGMWEAAAEQGVTNEDGTEINVQEKVLAFATRMANTSDAALQKILHKGASEAARQRVAQPILQMADEWKILAKPTSVDDVLAAAHEDGYVGVLVDRQTRMRQEKADFEANAPRLLKDEFLLPAQARTVRTKFAEADAAISEAIAKIDVGTLKLSGAIPNVGSDSDEKQANAAVERVLIPQLELENDEGYAEGFALAAQGYGGKPPSAITDHLEGRFANGTPDQARRAAMASHAADLKGLALVDIKIRARMDQYLFLMRGATDADRLSRHIKAKEDIKEAEEFQKQKRLTDPGVKINERFNKEFGGEGIESARARMFAIVAQTQPNWELDKSMTEAVKEIERLYPGKNPDGSGRSFYSPISPNAWGRKSIFENLSLDLLANSDLSEKLEANLSLALTPEQQEGLAVAFVEIAVGELPTRRERLVLALEQLGVTLEEIPHASGDLKKTIYRIFADGEQIRTKDEGLEFLWKPDDTQTPTAVELNEQVLINIQGQTAREAQIAGLELAPFMRRSMRFTEEEQEAAEVRRAQAQAEFQGAKENLERFRTAIDPKTGIMTPLAPSLERAEDFGVPLETRQQ